MLDILSDPAPDVAVMYSCQDTNTQIEINIHKYTNIQIHTCIYMHDTLILHQVLE